MASVFITGSSDGLGLMVAKLWSMRATSWCCGSETRRAARVERSPAIASSAPAARRRCGGIAH